MRFAIGFMLAIIGAGALGAQTPQTPAKPQTPQQPTFRAGVSFVRVDVYPSANGQIVGDLKQDEFAVLEDGVPQRIETFEHIVLRAPGLEADRVEPRSQEESNEMAADPRNRLFVLVFDTLHTSGYQNGTGNFGTYDPRSIGRALVTFLDQLIGPDDLIALFRPDMAVDTLAFTRRPSSFMEFLLSGGEWQKRFLEGALDDTERKYEACYPPPSEFASKMIARRRELLALGGLRSLVTHLQSLREGRKAVVVISEGWRLFTPDNGLARPDRDQMPGPPPVTISGTGQPTFGSDPRNGNVMRSECERDRLMLARIDDEKEFEQLLQDANRANVTFYSVDPRGLTVESTFNRRSDSLISLATGTDGISLASSNNFAPGLKRIRDDLSSYYLLGYTSTNARFDGKFRTISVRVKRPGVSVRARPGYNAPTEAEVAARAKASAPRDPEEDLRGNALSALGLERADRPLRIGAGYAFDAAAADGEGQPAGAAPPGATPARRAVLWVAGELDAAAARTMEWSGGAEATIIVTGGDGQTVATARATLTPAAPRFNTSLPGPLKAGSYLVKVRAQAKPGGTGDTSAQLRVTVPDVSLATASILGPPMLFRRGPYTGVGYQPTADLRFRKAERIRVDVPVGGAFDSVAARLLDRKGQALPLPVTTGQRDDAGRRLVTAEVNLAPLAPADYLVEVSVRRGEKTEKMLTAFRIVP